MVARYQQLAADLRRDIERGTYPRGSTIPPISELTRRYDISKTMVSQVLRLLEKDGLVRAERGRGTIVLDRRTVEFPISIYGSVTTPGGPGGDKGPWETACARQGINGGMRTVEVVTEPAAPDVAAALGIGPGEMVARRTRHATIDDVPVQIQHAYYPQAIAAGTALERPEKVVGGVYRLLSGLGMLPGSYTLTLESRQPDDEEATELGLRGDAVSELVRVSYTPDPDRRPIEMLRVVATRTRFVLDNVPASSA